MRSSASRAASAFVLDAVLVIVFAATGRASHEESPWAGLALTAWPFLAGLVLGWLITLAWRAPSSPVRIGLGVWAITVAGGMLLRAASGQGTALPFIIVASIVLFVALVGWRIIAAAVARRRRG
ncbi:DUF3054 domain-containing protein [Microbacterium sp. cx-55]|uniref:DUF3054 domain-containing protein n=1 Tax=Microbacterium sp. cx-55 TaxID=2875948 RepID=UPI001CBD555E|nr:DUF3054 domain-containing protein [Microbacterium sp. cx-55]MBZ4486539.1 DUF3054 domain-containing protein [Microbacterium sp. cx-55]UGB36493.1 DUF3054 domain-containing protein [Microbacterium sp. cx-55]